MSFPARLYKFGQTTSADIMERFDEQRHQKRAWRSIPLSRDYTVKPLWSRWVTAQEAVEAEKWFADNYPKTFYCDISYNGIGECREWSPKESYAFRSLIDKKFPDRAGERKVNGYERYMKIYYVMLTKKVNDEIS